MASSVSTLTRTLKVTLLRRWRNGKSLSVLSRTGWLIIHFPLGLQIEWPREGLTLVSSQKIWDFVPVLPLIPSDLGWLRLVGRKFSTYKVRPIKPFFFFSGKNGRDKEGHIFERDGSELEKDLTSTRNHDRTWTLQADEARRIYHFNLLHCKYRSPKGWKRQICTSRQRGPCESRSEWQLGEAPYVEKSLL